MKSLDTFIQRLPRPTTRKSGEDSAEDKPACISERLMVLYTLLGKLFYSIESVFVIGKATIKFGGDIWQQCVDHRGHCKP